MMAFLKLIRWSNLLMMVLTLVGAFYANLCQVPNPSKLVFFGILIVSIVSVAAGGYAINDYFDLRSDRKNKPEKIVVGKHIKKRWAIIIHWSFSLLALSLSAYLSYCLHSWLYLTVHLLAILLLWYYSTIVKRVLLLPNFLISLMVAILPLLVIHLLHDLYLPLIHKTLFMFMALFMFITNLAREVVKDVQDMEGDALRDIKTVPLVYGRKKAYLVSATLLFCLLPCYAWLKSVLSFSNQSPFGMVFLLGIVVSQCMVLGLLWNRSPRWISFGIKISMLIGIGSLFMLCQ
ncbi:MAG: UbiA family prenyltransferase [Flavobacteriales bacterium]|jgi:4-hydroxybenzoate polyprenyltransferase